LAQDISGTLTIFDTILKSGFEGDDFMLGLGEHIRNLLVCKDNRTIKLLEVSGDLKERYETQSNLAPLSFILNALKLINDCDIHYKTAKNKRLTVELTLTKLCYIKDAVAIASSHGSAPSEAKKK
jgi:DNA polymerase-3 subunit gamma/tau